MACLTLIQVEFWVPLWEDVKDELAHGSCVFSQDHKYLPQFVSHMNQLDRCDSQFSQVRLGHKRL